MPRSAGAAILESLDSHPDILVWPFEFLYFDWFQNIAKDRKKAPKKELNENIVNMFLSRFPFRLIETEKYASKKINEFILSDLNFGSFNFTKFNELINSEEKEYFSANEYLNFIFQCLQNSNSQYKNNNVRYFLMYTTARGFNWADHKLISSSLILFTQRDVKEVYNSLKQKYSKKDFYLKLFFSIKFKKSMLYWIETFRQIDRLISKYFHSNNFHVIRLDNLHKNSENSLKKICSFLNVDINPSIFNLTIVGEKVAGNANEKNLNKGKIAKRKSKITFPMYSFEERLFNSFELFCLDKSAVRYNSLMMVFYAFKTSFLEIDSKKVSQRANYSLFFNLIDRLHILNNLLKSLFILKFEKKPYYTLLKNNNLVKKTPIFWFNTFEK